MVNDERQTDRSVQGIARSNVAANDAVKYDERIDWLNGSLQQQQQQQLVGQNCC